MVSPSFARPVRALAVLALASLAFVPAAPGSGYVFAGGTVRERAQVDAALRASAFDWSVIPATIEVHIAPGIEPVATPGHVWLDADLLRAGVFSWAVVQDEFAHQIDFFLLDDAERALLNRALRGRVWCHWNKPGLPHAAYGCERFSSTFVRAYWPSSANAYGRSAEARAMKPSAFRSLLQNLLGT